MSDGSEEISCPIEIRYSCKSCGSKNVSEEECIKHLPCGYTAVVDAFRFNGFRCPSCGKRLFGEGEDYIKTKLYLCYNCGYISEEPALKVTLRRCEELMELEEPVRAEASSRLDRVQAIEDALRGAGLTYQADYEVQGLSGISHSWDFMIWPDPSSTEPLIAIQLEGEYELKDPTSRSMEALLRLISLALKKLDSGIPYLVLLSDELDDGELQSLCKDFGIMIMRGKDPEAVLEKIEEIFLKERLGESIHKSTEV